MPSLHEKHRPADLESVVGQDKAIARIKTVLARGWGGRAWFITGGSGTGKTTLARIIARLGCDDWGIEELDAGRLTVAAVAKIVDGYRMRMLGGKQGKCFIVNEAHGLRRDTIRELLTALEPDGEPLPEHIVWVFTTTKTGAATLFDDCDDASPLVSRCTEIVLENAEDTQKAFARRAREIAVTEGIDGLPESVYVQAASRAKGNMRALLQRIESGAFRDDAREALERELAMVASTKGEHAEQRRQSIKAALASL